MLSERMDYPPPYLTIDKLAEHLCVSQQTVENWVERGILPQPRRPEGGGKGRSRIRLWKWKEVERAMDRLAQQEEKAPLSAEDIRRATSEAAARH